MIEGRNITKCFGDLVLFENFNFRIDDGEFIAFSGASGKGKTTLLNIIGNGQWADSTMRTIHQGTQWGVRVTPGLHVRTESLHIKTLTVPWGAVV